ncbi:glycosyltransferase family 4 protein [Streptomyces sp. NPDC050732]|uniref:glycosyltransferase family 4 protein n=1 Tax=Streptomyces sp. NPDC050732 TaxID=3154632 RepID=UPI003423FD01
MTVTASSGRVRHGVPGRSAMLLAGSTVVAGVGHYGLSLLLVRLLPAGQYTVHAAASSVLLTVGVLSTATVPAVLAREVVTTPEGSARRRAAVRACLRMTTVLAAGCALAACAAVAPYAETGLLVATAAASSAIWCNSAGAGYLQGTGHYGRLAGLQLVETAVRCCAALAAVGAGCGAAGVVGATAVAAGVGALGAVAGMYRRDAPRSVFRAWTRAWTLARTWSRMRGRSAPRAAGERTRRRPAPPTGLWRRTSSVAGVQVLLCLLLTGDVVLSTAVLDGDAALAPYQALAVIARVPLYLATATATVLYPRLVAEGTTSAPGRAALKEALRTHWITTGVLTAVLVTCPGELLALLLPGTYVDAAGLLLPLGIAGLAGATLTVTTTVFRSEPPVRSAVLLLTGGCLALACAATLTASHPPALAWSAAACTGLAAAGSVALTRRRVPGLGPAAGATAPLAAAVGTALALHQLRPHPWVWLPGAGVALLAAFLAARPRRRRSGPQRILHLGFEAPHAPGAGGAALRAHEVNRRLAARGVEVTVVCAPWPGCAASVRDGVRYRPLPPRPGPLARHRFLYQMAYFPVITLGLPWLLRRTDPDLVVEDFVPPFSSVCVPYLTRRPVIGVVQWLSAAEMTARYRLPFHLVERRGLRSHTRLVTVGRHLAAELRSRHPAADVVVLPNGLAPAAFVPSRSAPRRDLVYLGRLETKSKGLDLLLRAYAQAAPALTSDLLIAGDGPDEQAARALAARLGVDHRLHWLGRVDGDARFHLLASARLVCVPSRSETFGIVAAEALAAATPVLSFDLPCLRDLVTETVGVRIPAGDVAAYGRALAELAADPARCRALGTAGPDTVRHLDWDVVAEQQLAQYRMAMEAGEPGRWPRSG